MGMLEGFTQFINIKIAGTSTLGGAVLEVVSQMDDTASKPRPRTL